MATRLLSAYATMLCSDNAGLEDVAAAAVLPPCKPTGGGADFTHTVPCDTVLVAPAVLIVWCCIVVVDADFQTEVSGRAGRSSRNQGNPMRNANEGYGHDYFALPPPFFLLFLLLFVALLFSAARILCRGY